jgi:hypothetical protein
VPTSSFEPLRRPTVVLELPEVQETLVEKQLPGIRVAAYTFVQKLEVRKVPGSGGSPDGPAGDRDARGEVSAYIPTTRDQLTDGQIYLETDLFSPASARP